MRHLISLTFILFFFTAPLATQKKQSGAAQNDQPIRFRLGNDGFLCEVARVDADGTVVLNTAKRGIRGAPAQIALTEGFYLGLAAERASQLPHDALFMRVRITEVLDSGRAR